MLNHLNIRGFALIDQLSLSFHRGMTVLTGETGAGKSIIVDALQVILGEKVDPAMIRTGEDMTRVEASFLPPDGLLEPDSDNGEVIISREAPREGRGRILIDGSLTPLARLRTLGEGLVDLHGQHEHQSLLKASAHLAALDSFAGTEDTRLRHEGLFREREEVIRRIGAMEDGARERAARKDYLRFVVRELEAAGLSEGEEDELREEEVILSSAERLMATAGEVLESLYQSDSSLADGVGRAASALRALVDVDGRLLEPADMLDSSLVQLEEAAHFLRDYGGKVQADPARLAVVSDRLALIADLKKKYGPGLGDVLSFLDSSREELDGLDTAEDDAESLRVLEEQMTGSLDKMASELREGRRSASASFEDGVQSELADLAMERVRFSVQFVEAEHGPSGRDNVEFLISPNPGEPLMPLRKIASGGELSRVMLAVKKILAGADAVPTLIFDEIDSGIGGRVAGVLGRKLKEISGHHQVLCITHLAPVAAFADHHIIVRKRQEKGRTVVGVSYLNPEERVEELARMMGGMEVTPSILKSARELLEETVG